MTAIRASEARGTAKNTHRRRLPGPRSANRRRPARRQRGGRGGTAGGGKRVFCGGRRCWRFSSVIGNACGAARVRPAARSISTNGGVRIIPRPGCRRAGKRRRVLPCAPSDGGRRLPGDTGALQGLAQVVRKRRREGEPLSRDRVLEGE